MADQTRSPPLPRYRLMADDLRTEILDGRRAPGDQLPTESDLARRYGVSRGTAIKAIDQLVAQGIVKKHQGSGSFVSLPSLRRRSSLVLSFTRSVRAQGRTPTQRVLSFGVASDSRARALGLIEPSMELRRLRYVDGVACAIHTSIVPQRVIDRFVHDDLSLLTQTAQTAFSLYDAFERAGVVVERGSESLSARLAADHEAQLLHVGQPTALMMVMRQSFDVADLQIEATEAIYHADYYTYDLELERKTTGTAPLRLLDAEQPD